MTDSLEALDLLMATATRAIEDAITEVESPDINHAIQGLVTEFLDHRMPPNATSRAPLDDAREPHWESNEQRALHLAQSAVDSMQAASEMASDLQCRLEAALQILIDLLLHGGNLVAQLAINARADDPHDALTQARQDITTNPAEGGST